MDCNQACMGIARLFGNIAYYLFLIVIGTVVLLMALEQVAVGLGKLRVVLGRIRFGMARLAKQLQQTTWLRWPRTVGRPSSDSTLRKPAVTTSA